MRLELAVAGPVRAAVAAGGQAILLRDAAGEVRLRYGGLRVWDAEGTELAARLEAGGDHIALLVEDAGARYPLTIDPTIVNEDAKLTASDAAGGDEFGISVSISGDTVVVGARFDACPAGVGCGSAYVFEKPAGGWAGALIEDAKLTASDAGVFDEFGISVSISGDTVVVAALGSDGAAYVFEKPAGGWAGALTEDAKLTASDGAPGDFFGVSVSISGDTVVVGFLFDACTAGIDCGSAYVFEKPAGGWAGTLTEDAKLTASDAAAGDFFGIAVSISGETVVVGAYLDDCTAGIDCGSAYVFEKPAGGWAGALSEDAKLTASDAATGDGFGVSVSISGDTVAVGAGCTTGNDCGSAYVFAGGRGLTRRGLP